MVVVGFGVVGNYISRMQFQSVSLLGIDFYEFSFFFFFLAGGLFRSCVTQSVLARFASVVLDGQFFSQ